MDAWISAGAANGVGVVGTVFLMGTLIFRGHLIPGKWHKEALGHAREAVDRAEKRADRWEAVALRALDATERLTEPVEVASRVLTRLPNPSQEGQE